MELDKEVKRKLIEDTKKYLKKKKVPYRFITIRDGLPVVIVDEDTFYKLLDRSLDGRCITGRFIAQGENGWSAYYSEDEMRSFNLMEGMTEYEASRFVLSQEFGRKPKTSRYAGGCS